MVFGILIAAMVGIWVATDANKHAMKGAVLWGIGVFLVLIVFLPVYLIVRYQHEHAKPATPAGLV